MKNALFSKHDRFNIHNEETTREIHTLHDKIENELKFKSYFNIYKVDDNRRKEQISTSSNMKKHEHEQACEKLTRIRRIVVV